MLNRTKLQKIALVYGRSAVILGIFSGLCAVRAAVAAESKTLVTNLSAAQIVEKYVTARGGAVAWRAVQTLSVRGKLDAGRSDSAARAGVLTRQGAGASVRHGGAAAAQTAGAADEVKVAEAKDVQLAFRLEMKRSLKSRLEIDFAGKTAVQVYDGQHGWKLRPFLNRDDVEPFTADEARAEAAKADLDGPLADYAVKGSQVALEGTEPVDGHNAFKLKVTTKSGDIRHVWIDAQSFLDVKVEGVPRRMDGKMHNVYVYQRDFRAVQGLMIPFTLESAVDGSPRAHKLMIESVAVNPPLEDVRFAKPQVLVASH